MNTRKSKYLILNFTVPEREELKQLYLKSHSASESDFVRKAVELYADLYQYVLDGAKIVLNHPGKGPRTVAVPKHWNREDAPLPERDPSHRNFELKIKGATKAKITQMVKAGAAPSAARLALAALGAYALIVERTAQGFVLMQQHGQELLPIS